MNRKASVIRCKLLIWKLSALTLLILITLLYIEKEDIESVNETMAIDAERLGIEVFSLTEENNALKQALEADNDLILEE